MTVPQHPGVHAIVPAAGAGRRLARSFTGKHADKPKQYQLLLGRPLLEWTIECLCTHPMVKAVTVALAPGDTDFMNLRFRGSTPVDWAAGGETRAHSVRNALHHVVQTSNAQWALVHDAARPCLDRPSLDRLFSQGMSNDDGAILAVPVSDTLKRSPGGDNPVIESTLDRDGLWAAQTPQLFPVARLAGALDARLRAQLPPTDEAGAMEAAGARPRLVRGAVTNLKVTWPGDLAVAEAILRQMERDQ